MEVAINPGIVTKPSILHLLDRFKKQFAVCTGCNSKHLQLRCFGLLGIPIIRTEERQHVPFPFDFIMRYCW